MLMAASSGWGWDQCIDVNLAQGPAMRAPLTSFSSPASILTLGGTFYAINSLTELQFRSLPGYIIVCVLRRLEEGGMDKGMSAARAKIAINIC